mmetsp:Transcript_27496/g.40986  ORF Transcript_27496/g.40986 Transcript_27496/m.40986 type:complete len:154 (-) Transcript_27496:347-808(-)
MNKIGTNILEIGADGAFEIPDDIQDPIDMEKVKKNVENSAYGQGEHCEDVDFKNIPEGMVIQPSYQISEFTGVDSENPDSKVLEVRIDIQGESVSSTDINLGIKSDWLQLEIPLVKNVLRVQLPEKVQPEKSSCKLSDDGSQLQVLCPVALLQ